MNDRLLAVRRRLRDDFPFYAQHALKVRTKSAEIVPFRFNAAQRVLSEAVERQYAKTGRVRVVILKGRQMGLSTYVGGRLYGRVSQLRAKKAMVVTHHSDSTKALFEMTKRYHDNIPEALRASTRYDNKRELKFDVLDSGYVVATAGADSVGRGETLTHLHLSEVAFWLKSQAKTVFNGLIQAVPNTPDTEVYVESTANGVSGLFYDLWQAAVSGESEFTPVFLPWFIDPDYRVPVPEGFERTVEEDKLVALYDLDDEQLMFRRVKIANGSPELFRQEYPCTANEAFLTSGRPVFHPDRVAEMLAVAPKPIMRMALEGKKFEEHPRGELKVFHPLDDKDRYVIGADIGMGVRKDFSVAQVLDGKRRQVAVWRGQADPALFAEILYALGRRFNDATIIPEANGHGLLTCWRLYKELDYWNVYQDKVLDKTADEETERVGFNTNVKTKPMIIDKLRAELRLDGIQIYDETTLQEMQQFIVTDTGKMEAEAGCHDDCVMALALANHAHLGVYEPIVNDERWYIETE